MIPKVECCIEALRGGVKQDAHHRRPRAARRAARDLHRPRASAPRWCAAPRRGGDRARAARREHDQRRDHRPHRRATCSASTRARRSRSCAAQGCEVWDADGKRYLDFFAGIVVTNLGHCHPAVVEAIRRQAGELLHVSNLHYSEPQARAGRAARAGTRSPTASSSATAAPRPTRRRSSWRASWGARARRRALRDRHRRSARSTAAPSATITATGQEKVRTRLRAAACRASATCPTTTSPRSRRRSAPRTVAIMVEPIQGEGGIVVPQPDYLRGAARALRPRTACC